MFQCQNFISTILTVRLKPVHSKIAISQFQMSSPQLERKLTMTFIVSYRHLITGKARLETQLAAPLQITESLIKKQNQGLNSSNSKSKIHARSLGNFCTSMT